MQTEYLVAIPLLLQIICLIFAVIVDTYIKKTHKCIMMIIAFLVLSLIAQNVFEYILAEFYNMPYLRTIVAIYGYCIRPLVIMLFFYIVGENRRHLLFWILIGVNTAVHQSAIFSDLCFSINEDNIFQRGSLSYTCHNISVVMLAYLVYLTYRECSRAKRLDTLIPAFIALLIVASVAVEALVDLELHVVSYLTMAVVSGTLFYYIWLHLRFVREHERALLAEQRIKVMISQIQPHFLYNTLSTIQALCLSNPQKAFEITERFGAYLRENINSLSQPDLIPVTKELAHTKIYAEIEMTRFENITVEYDTPETGFSLPAFTIQPLVENAIRHGVRIREKGIVKVSTRKISTGYMIVIEDNGKGFDVSLAQKSDSNHIGLRNVKERIQSMCGGDMNIESKENIGTKITIIIPIKMA